MNIIKATNVNEALVKAMIKFSALEKELGDDTHCARGRRISPRGQETLELDGTVMTVYENPMERVLFHPDRDANPFFHLMESLWILAGSNDVEFLKFFNSRMSEFSDDGKIFHAPYGYRLRYSQSLFHNQRAVIDQIQSVCEMLQKDPDSRQAVMQIWEAGLDLNTESKDIPCNDMIFAKVRDGKLNITVCNRSNDVLWGAYGANVVQFSMLQEYMAAWIGVGVGTYIQVSDSFHVYTNNPLYEKLKDLRVPFDLYETPSIEPFPLVTMDIRAWGNQLKTFMIEARHAMGPIQLMPASIFAHSDPFFAEVAVPMFNAYVCHKNKQKGVALMWAGYIAASDWRYACEEWLSRRYSK